VDRWGANLDPLSGFNENPTLARAVAAASNVAGRAGDGAVAFNRDEQRQLEAPLKMPNGKPLRASAAMDVWSLGLIAYELFANEPFFAGCSDDVALQVLASPAPLELPLARIVDSQAQHLLVKMLAKRPKERASLDAILRHAYLVGGLDTQEIGGSFAMLHSAQASFKDELSRLKTGGGAEATTASSFAAARQRTHSSFKRGGGLADKRATFGVAQGETVDRRPPTSVLEGAGAIPRRD